MPVTYASVLSSFSDAAPWISAICAVITIFLTFYNLDRWKKEKTWSYKYDTAKDLIVAAYHYRDFVRMARFGVLDEKGYRARYAKLCENLVAECFAAEIIWGQVVVDAVNELLNVGYTFWIAYAEKHSQSGQIPSEQIPSTIERIKIVTGMNDEFDQKLMKAVANLQDIVKKYLTMRE
jgi:hypothetical protein